MVLLRRPGNPVNKQENMNVAWIEGLQRTGWGGAEKERVRDGEGVFRCPAEKRKNTGWGGGCEAADGHLH